MRITCHLKDGRKLIILDKPIERLISYRQLNIKHKEAGGLLTGRHLSGNENIVVDHITEPTRWDKRLFTYFFRSNKHNIILNKRWISSDRTQTLIGLWHTHPESFPVPSKVDLEDWKNTLLKGEFVGDFLLFIIVGTEKIRLWQGNRKLEISKLFDFSLPFKEI
jgi:integrative and conjugative element protein (TIGR02256 family)